MSLAAQGAYRNLLDAAWERGGSLPNTPDVLWRYALAQSAVDFAAVSDAVLAMFTLSEDGKFLLNDTLQGEWEDASEKMERISSIRSEAGKRGAMAKWQNDGKQMANDGTGQDRTVQETPMPDAGAPAMSQLRGLVKTVFDYYLAKTGRNPKQYEFTDKRRDKGVSRLKEFQKQCDGDIEKAGAMMRRAVDGICADPWDDRVRFREWDKHLFGSQESAEKWRNAPLRRINGKLAPLPVSNRDADEILARQLGGGR